ncbi:MAG: hypothetical protein K6F60_03300 [Eubacterium sp.]|nr:hypothetical protein [Eubacterium sp.]
MKRARKLALLLVSIMILSLLSGCMRYSTTIDVKRNGKADIKMLVAVMNTGTSSDSDTEETEAEETEEMKKLRDQGWEVKAYNEEGYEGYECVKRNVDLKEIAKELQDSESEDADVNPENFKITKKGLGYILDWKLYDDDNTEEMSEYSESIKQYNGYFRVIIKLPNKPKNHNATSVSHDGKTLTWDLLSMDKSKPIHVEFSLINWPLIIGIIVALLLIIAGAVVFFILGKKRREGGGNMANPFPGQGGPGPQQFGQQPQFDPATGQPMQPQQFGQQPQFDPATGQPMQPQQFGQQPQFDPATGQPMQPQQFAQQPQFDPATGQPMQPQQFAQQPQFDPTTGQPMQPQFDPTTGQPYDPNNQQF